jgi:density-regulated protein DRP1
MLREVQYCGICSLPFEYCEFHPSASKCAQWLEQNLPDEYARLYSGTAERKAGELHTASSRGGKAQLKDEGKRLEKEQEARQSARVTLRRDARSKRKSTTSIVGLQVFGVDLKKAARRLASRFACGCSVQVNEELPGTPEEVTLQGDYVQELLQALPEEFPEVKKEQIDIFQ